MYKLAIFASGSGSNAQRIAEYFRTSREVEVACIITNRKEAYVLKRAAELQIPSVYFSKADFYSNGNVLKYLEDKQITHIILAGFLWLFPSEILEKYPNKVINIHPALLPKYGGKNMYGMHVHQAVISNKEKESGISIHLVNEEYDKGKILFQAKCSLEEQETAESLAEKIHQLEYRYFPEVIEKTLLD